MTAHDALREPPAALPAMRSSLAEARFPQWLLNVGFCTALVIATVCLILSASYLFTFLQATNSGVETLLRNALNTSTPTSVIQLSILARTAMARFALLSCGVCVGMGFGFLGFALFLLGIKGEMDVEARHEQANVKIARMAPGVFVILCATILVALCVTFRTQYEWSAGETTEQEQPVRTNEPAGPPANLPNLRPGEAKP
jgi:hypothetical protein